jgi:hypothetical protein
LLLHRAEESPVAPPWQPPLISLLLETADAMANYLLLASLSASLADAGL